MKQSRGVNPGANTMAEKILSLEELKGQQVEQVLQEVAETGESLLVHLPGGRAIRIAPVSFLRPLSTLEGIVPEGWKDALYGSPSR